MRLSLIAAALLLSACQLALSGKTRDEPAVNPITTGEISVTSLDSPGAAEQVPVPETAPVPPEQLAAEPQTVDAPASTPPPPVSKSASHLACDKGGGKWVAAGGSGTMSCQTPQRDGGKQCSRDSDCEGQCLARSRTCAPYAPLFGCNEVLQDNGQRVTLCIE